MSQSSGPVRFAVVTCALGLAAVAVRKGHVCCIELGDDPRDLADALARRFPGSELDPVEPETEPLLAQVLAVLESGVGMEDLPLDPGGTPFQQLVWSHLRAIPEGKTRTYSQVAVAIGRPTASRAVATACASNRIAVVIPCHRVVRSDGSISGYRWGVARKRALLAREQAASGLDWRGRHVPQHPRALQLRPTRNG